MAILVTVAGAVIMLSVACVAQDAGSNRSQPHFRGQAPGEVQAILHKLKGSVSSVDTNAMTLTIKLAQSDRVFKLVAKTKFSRGDNPALLKDLSVGQTVEVVLKTVYGQADEVVSVNILQVKQPDASRADKTK